MILTSKPGAPAFTCLSISLASGDQLATDVVEQKYQQLAHSSRSSLNQQLTVLVYKYLNFLLPQGNNCEVFSTQVSMRFPGSIKFQLPMVAAVLMMQLSFPVSLPTLFSVFSGTTSTVNNLHSNPISSSVLGRTLQKTESRHTLKRRKFARTQLSSGP